MAHVLPLLLLLSACCCLAVYGQDQATLSVEQELELVKRQLLIPGYPAIGKRSLLMPGYPAIGKRSLLMPGYPAIGKRTPAGAETAVSPSDDDEAVEEPAALDRIRCAVSRGEFQQLRRTVVSIYLRMLERELRSRDRQPQPQQPLEQPHEQPQLPQLPQQQQQMRQPQRLTEYPLE